MHSSRLDCIVTFNLCVDNADRGNKTPWDKPVWDPGYVKFYGGVLHSAMFDREFL